MNLKKKIVALGMVCVLALGMATSVFAGANDKITDMRYIGVDAPHGTIYGLDSSGQLVMNQSTSSNITQSGTKVTTWSRTGHTSQYWETWSVEGHPDFNNARLILPESNTKLSININRTTYAVNVYEILGNYYRDCALEINSFYNISDPNDSNKAIEVYSFYVKPRYSSETTAALMGTKTKGAAFSWQRGSTSGTKLYRIGA
ncbi:hypothetical protein [Allofournierella massiliensis]|uniref:hypothetical protein n=1 Tax=Allofournierella massiliensis TaxID=1650663 RepID=UPI0024B13393|nr:hypothetical protein [Fournierella massiliensis]